MKFFNKAFLVIFLFFAVSHLWAGPAIDVWYGSNQKFGNVGISQKWVNIYGDVAVERVEKSGD